MPDKSNCPVCGAPMPPDFPGGNCPRCLLGLAAGGLPVAAAKPRDKSPARFGSKPPTFFGDYELLGEIARGGMGVVYRARQLSLNRLVAVKMILDGPLAVPGFIQRFQMEAEAAAKLSHPNIVPIYEIGEYDGRHFFSMKLFEGGHLGDQSARCSPPNQKDGATACHQRQVEIAQLVRMVAEGVHHAHQRGILHRDLKPANILMDDEGRPHVADFGLAKLMGDNSLLTQTGALSGTPAYMAPEQAAGESAPLTTATDIYSLGAILYQLMTGQPPFRAPTTVQTLRQVVENEAVPPQRLNPAVDRRLSTICLKCLQKEPARRYTSARALAEDLQRWQNGETILALPSTRAENIERWCRRNPAIATLGMLFILALMAVAIVSTTEAYHIKHARDDLVAAEKDAKAKLWNSLLAQARAERWSGRPGQRFNGLDAINSAAALRESTSLRSEAIACLALDDVRLVTNLFTSTNWAEKVFIDWPRKRIFRSDAHGAITARGLDDRTELLSLPAVGRLFGFRGISPDGRWLALSLPNDKVSIIDLTHAAPMLTLDDASDVEFSPDSKRAGVDVGTNSFTLVALDGSGFTKAYPLPGGYSSFVWSPDSKLIAFPGRNKVYMVNVAEDCAVRQFTNPATSLHVAWNPDGIHLALAGDDRLVRILNAVDGTYLPPLAGHLGSVTGVAFHPNGQLLASVGWDGQLRLWNWEKGKEIIAITAGPEGISFSPDGKRLAVYARGQSRVTVFELALNQSVVAVDSNRTPRTGSGDALLFGPETSWLAVSVDDSTSFWEPATGKFLARLEKCPYGYLQPVSSTGQFLACNREIYSIKPEWKNGELHVNSPDIFQPYIPDGILQLTNSVNFSDQLKHHEVWLGGTANGKLAAVVCAERCYIFDTISNRLQAVTGKHSFMKYVAVSPDGRWVATGGWHDSFAKVWNATNGSEVASLRTDNSTGVAFSPDGRWLVTSTGEEYRFWHTGTWTSDHAVQRPDLEGLPGPMAFSPDGSLLALVHARGTILLVSPDTGALLAQIDPIPGNDIVGMAFSSDASELAVTRVDAPPQVWHIRKIREQLSAMSLDW